MPGFMSGSVAADCKARVNKIQIFVQKITQKGTVCYINCIKHEPQQRSSFSRQIVELFLSAQIV